MHCASCAQRVQKTLGEADGVLVAAVAALGYELVPAHEGAAAHDDGRDSESAGRGRVIAAALLLSMLGIMDTWALWL